jgi:hypothetical protein
MKLLVYSSCLSFDTQDTVKAAHVRRCEKDKLWRYYSMRLWHDHRAIAPYLLNRKRSYNFNSVQEVYPRRREKPTNIIIIIIRSSIRISQPWTNQIHRRFFCSSSYNTPRTMEKVSSSTKLKSITTRKYRMPISTHFRDAIHEVSSTRTQSTTSSPIVGASWSPEWKAPVSKSLIENHQQVSLAPANMPRF